MGPIIFQIVSLLKNKNLVLNESNYHSNKIINVEVRSM